MPTVAIQTVRTIRRGFAAMACLVVVVGLGFAWHSWQTEKEHELLYLSTIVELTGNGMNRFFSQYERGLADLSEKIPAGTSPADLNKSYQLLKAFQHANPELARMTLSLPDGQMLLSTSLPLGSPMPNRSPASTLQESLKKLESGQKIVIERAMKGAIDGQWIIPIRYAVRDGNGRVRLLIAAVLPVSQQLVLWQDVPLPAEAAFGLLRDDAFILSRYPSPKKINYEELYSKPRNGQLVEYLRQNDFPVRGTTEGYNSVAKADYLFAFHRLRNYPLTVFVSTPVSNLRQKWFDQAQFAIGLTVLLLIGGGLIFRWATVRQLAWEKERAENEATIEFLAHHDALTGLPNRVLARDRMQQACAFAERSQARVALLFLDLDNFKAINDSLGHTIGDALLKAVSERLRACLRDTDTLSRQGGDEFLLILADIRAPGVVTRVTEAIFEALAQPFHIDDHELTTSASVGLAVFPEDGRDFETLLKMADTAMYHAKAAGRNAYRYFTEEMNAHADENLRMRTWLRQGLAQNNFVLHFQPQIDLQSGRVIGAEALVRLQHGDELVAPGRFIAIAEDSGLIVPLGEWVLLQACRTAVEWRQTLAPDLVVAVNISAVQFRRGNLEYTITTALAASGLPPQGLELELTESILIEGTSEVLETVRRLQAIGVRFSIDDFGTGYSSLAYLKRFNLDKLKIDQSFVRDMVNDADDAAIVHALIQMAHSLNIKTIAEGVEDEATRAILVSKHCDEAQGYYFARPLPAAEFVQYLSEGQPVSNNSSGATIIPLPHNGH